MMRSFLLAILLLSNSYCVFAFEPPHETVEEALKIGSTAFLARAVKMERTDEKENEVTAKVELQVLYCFYGGNCRKGKTIYMRYIIKTIKESALPVQFPLDTDIIFILSHQLGERPYFDSKWHGGIDRAYICDNYPSPILNSTEEVRCNSIYGGKKYSWVKWSNLKKYSPHKE